MAQLGEIEVINGRPAKGLPFLERAEVAAPSSVEVHLKLAEAYVALDECAMTPRPNPDPGPDP